MLSKKEQLVEYMRQCAQKDAQNRVIEFTTQELALELNIGRQNMSTLLNQLVREKQLEKTNGRPVRYKLNNLPNISDVEKSCFKQLIGHDGSLKSMIKLAKAVILYPDQSLHTLILGANGTGRSFFAKLMVDFAREVGALAEDAPFIKCNCRYYNDDERKGKRPWNEKEWFYQAQGGVLFFDNIDQLSNEDGQNLLSCIEERSQEADVPFVICSASDNMPKFLLDNYKAKFLVKIELPTLKECILEERFALIQHFFNEEANKMQRSIKVNAEILRCFLLYHCENNIKQLQNDIRISCANAYLRDFNKASEELYLYMDDCPAYVQKGFLYYREQCDEVDTIILGNYSYIFSGEETKKQTVPVYTEEQFSIYDIIDKKAEKLRGRGISEESIAKIVCSDLEKDIQKMTENAKLNKMDREVLSKVVDVHIIELVNQFLDHASERLRRVFPVSTFSGLCLNISSFLEQQHAPQMENEQIKKITDKYQEEYVLCQHFAEELEKEYKTELSLDEVLFMTMLISGSETVGKLEQKPVVLVAMHGNGCAAAMVDVIKSLTQCDNTFAFDMCLEQGLNDAYEDMKKKICHINQGKGILLLYDMGSLCKLAMMVSRETGIPVRALELPATLIALDCSRKASSSTSLDEMYDSVAETYLYRNQHISEEYKRQMEHRIVITLCMTGDGSGVQMKNYLEKNLSLDDVTVVPMAVSDRLRLLREVNHLKQSHQILYIIGTYDPHIHGIPFISITQLFETPVDKLELLLSLDTAFIPEVENLPLDSIVQYLSEELPELDTRTLKRVLPKVIQQLKRRGQQLTPDQEVGLYMHIACAIAHLQQGVLSASNPRKDMIISKNKRLYNDLSDLLAPVQMSFGIMINDDEKANIISIIKQL